MKKCENPNLTLADEKTNLGVFWVYLRFLFDKLIRTFGDKLNYT